jgi:hypothetical protein
MTIPHWVSTVNAESALVVRQIPRTNVPTGEQENAGKLGNSVFLTWDGLSRLAVWL